MEWKNWLRAYKTGNVSKTVEDRAKDALTTKWSDGQPSVSYYYNVKQ